MEVVRGRDVYEEVAASLYVRKEPKKDDTLGARRPVARMKQVGMKKKAKMRNNLIWREEASLIW